MKRISLVIFLLSALVSCCHDGSVEVPKALISIEVDWSLFQKETVTGMSIYCYPRSGESPILVKTNALSRALLNLPEGTYDFIVINQSENEFGRIEFSGMDTFKTASVYPVTYPIPWNTDINTMYDTEWFALDSYEGLVITKDMAEMKDEFCTLTDDGVSVASIIELHPENVTYQTNLKVNIHNIDKVYSVRAIISSLAGGIRLCDGDVSSFISTCKSMDQWTRRLSENPFNGTISYGFVCFGTSRTEQSLRDNELDISFLLVDSRTVSSFHYEIGGYMDVDNESKTITIEIGSDDVEPEPEGYDCNPLAPLLIPEDIEPGGTGSSFDIEVEDWGAIISLEIPV